MKIEKKMLSLVTAGIFVATVAFGSTAFARKMEFVAIATGGTGGVYYPLGGALAQVVSNKVDGVSASAQSGNASVANCNLVSKNDVETALVQNNVSDQAYKGEGPWKGRALKNLRAISSLYPETIQILARAETGIRTIPDCKGKKIAVGDRGSGTEIDTRNILKFHDMTYKDIKAIYVDYSVAAQRIKDDQADMLFKTAGFPTSAIIDMTMTKDLNFVALTDSAIAKLCKQFPFYTPMTIPAGTYKGQDYDVKTISMMAIWVTNEQASEELVYKMTKALYDKTALLYRKNKDQESGADILAKVHTQGKNVTLDTALVGITIPLHPGAEKYYKEVGLIK